MGGDEITEDIAKEAMRLAQYKLPVKTKFITSEDQLKDTSEDENSLQNSKEVKS